jgi:flavodoxin
MSGNTAYVADRLKEQLGSEVDLIEIKPVKAFPDSGFKKFLWGGKSAVMAQKPKLQPYTFDAEKYDQIIIGFPVWASRIAPPIPLKDRIIGKLSSAFGRGTATA